MAFQETIRNRVHETKKIYEYSETWKILDIWIFLVPFKNRVRKKQICKLLSVHRVRNNSIRVISNFSIFHIQKLWLDDYHLLVLRSYCYNNLHHCIIFSILGKICLKLIQKIEENYWYQFGVKIKGTSTTSTDVVLVSLLFTSNMCLPSNLLATLRMPVREWWQDQMTLI